MLLAKNVRHGIWVTVFGCMLIQAPVTAEDIIENEMMEEVGEEAAKPVLVPEDLELPKVPKQVMNRNGSGGTGEKVVSMKSNSQRFVVSVSPGINQVIPISLGHLNRIVTPFDTPFVNTVSDATIEAHENVLYVATASEMPVTLFITPDVNDETMAISLTLSPKKIPPIEATLKFEDAETGISGFRHSNKKAEKWETSRPYIETIKSTMRKIALGELPDGYSMSKVKKNSIIPTCLQEGFRYDFVNGQYLEGHNIVVAVGTMANVSSQAKEIDETACIDGSIVAVASWPHTIFEPGDKSEIYVMMRTDLDVKGLKDRPSLLGGE